MNPDKKPEPPRRKTHRLTVTVDESGRIVSSKLERLPDDL